MLGEDREDDLMAAQLALYELRSPACCAPAADAGGADTSGADTVVRIMPGARSEVRLQVGGRRSDGGAAPDAVFRMLPR